MKKTQIILSNTVLENVFGILFSRLESGSGMSQGKVIVKDDYPDGVTRNITYRYDLMRPTREKDKLFVRENSYISVFPGKTDLTAEEIVFTDNTFSGLVFTGWQVKTNTVRLELEYKENWQDLVNTILSELGELFSESKTEQTATVDQDARQMDFPEEQRKEFDCSQDELFETIKNLYTQIQWPTGYHFGPWKKSAPDNIQLQIDKERPLKLGEPITFENNIGRITIGKINSQVSTLTVRTDNTDLLQFFEDLTGIVSKYLPVRLGPVGRLRLKSDSVRQVALNSTSVIVGSEYDDLSVKELRHKAARFDAMRYGDVDTQATQVDKAKPELPKWKTIVPDKGDDWQMLELWDKNHTNSEIGERLNKAPRTITNRISALRLRYPNAGILKDDERRKLLQRS